VLWSGRLRVDVIGAFSKHRVAEPPSGDDARSLLPAARSALFTRLGSSALMSSYPAVSSRASLRPPHAPVPPRRPRREAAVGEWGWMVCLFPIFPASPRTWPGSWAGATTPSRASPSGPGCSERPHHRDLGADNPAAPPVSAMMTVAACCTCAISGENSRTSRAGTSWAPRRLARRRAAPRAAQRGVRSRRCDGSSSGRRRPPSWPASRRHRLGSRLPVLALAVASYLPRGYMMAILFAGTDTEGEASNGVLYSAGSSPETRSWAFILLASPSWPPRTPPRSS
jgi:hypothetical protein